MRLALTRIAQSLILYSALLSVTNAEPIQLLQWTCAPSLDYLGVSVIEMDIPDYLSSDPKKEKFRVAMWRKIGIYDPQKLDMQCNVNGSVFELKSSEVPNKYSRGDVHVTFTFNGKAILKDVVFSSVGAGPELTDEAISSIAVWQRLGNEVARMSICFVNGASDKKRIACTGLFSLVGGSSRFPLQGDLKQFVPPDDARLYQIDGP
jgi:hypothetical protein